MEADKNPVVSLHRAMKSANQTFEVAPEIVHNPHTPDGVDTVKAIIAQHPSARRTRAPIKSSLTTAHKTAELPWVGPHGDKRMPLEERMRVMYQDGVAVYFPLTDTIAQYAAPDIHYAALTNRNRGLISPEAQECIRECPIGFAGLSVGSSGLMTCAMEGWSNIRGMDGDILETPNTNRLNVPASWVGLPKAAITQHRLTELNPYGRWDIRNAFVTKDNVKEFMRRLKIAVDEVDDVGAKELLRKAAREYGVDLITVADVGHRIVVDVEPWRSNPKAAKEFRGVREKMGEKKWREAPNLAKITQIIGLGVIPQEMFDAAVLMQQGKIGSIPQTASTVALAGSAIAYTAQRLALGEPVPLRTIIDLKKELGTRGEPVGEQIRAWARLQETRAIFVRNAVASQHRK